jgi:hypothetical protein
LIFIIRNSSNQFSCFEFMFISKSRAWDGQVFDYQNYGKLDN